ncbi:hypothetical protein SDC9_92359 [bioreactor metagenome]|uniref:Uncharacterized protein n=1 Tax=bioreactor metagenome TaxID=1076179 RepID=A0A644ZXH6_9ZZZZ
MRSLGGCRTADTTNLPMVCGIIGISIGMVRLDAGLPATDIASLPMLCGVALINKRMCRFIMMLRAARQVAKIPMLRAVIRPLACVGYMAESGNRLCL